MSFQRKKSRNTKKTKRRMKLHPHNWVTYSEEIMPNGWQYVWEVCDTCRAERKFVVYPGGECNVISTKPNNVTAGCPNGIPL